MSVLRQLNLRLHRHLARQYGSPGQQRPAPHRAPPVSPALDSTRFEDRRTSVFRSDAWLSKFRNNSRSQRILWLLEALNIKYEMKKYMRDSKTMRAPKELTQVHPLGKSPVITDGDLVVAESGRPLSSVQLGPLFAHLASHRADMAWQSLLIQQVSAFYLLLIDLLWPDTQSEKAVHHAPVNAFSGTSPDAGAIVEYLVGTYGQGRLIPPPGTPERLSYTFWLHFAEGMPQEPCTVTGPTSYMSKHELLQTPPPPPPPPPRGRPPREAFDMLLM